ncbi:hypothetical protein LSTR_LSTR000940 [Laodelphax striatellus]|uniref:C2H2-type domain-containing protein n=1 Tax=Laodelphax striatellus TaxID=195883 RepID=A0A482X0S7_LAOST|nr:hypothetical protein LSTR_LSTR000940 [Laodelphax striatellus]
MLTVSEFNNKFVCQGCCKVYKYKRSLNTHQRLECGKEPQFQCPYCDKRSHQKQALKSHVFAKHSELLKDQLPMNENKRFVCNLCGKGYKYKSNMTMHQRYECGKEPQFQCPYCVPMNANEQFVCNVCGKGYKYKSNMRSHQRYECGKEPQFQCPYCGKRCHLKGALKQHVVAKHMNLIDDGKI